MEQKNLTFDDLEFNLFEVVIRPVQPNGAARYNTLTIRKPIENVRDFMYKNLGYHMNQVCQGNYAGQFFGGAAYMRDGSVLIIYNGMQDAQADKLYAMMLEPDYYKKAKTPEGVNLENNIQYVSAIFNARQPRALILLQEIESPTEDMLHFRIIHNREDDFEPVNEEK